MSDEDNNNQNNASDNNAPMTKGEPVEDFPNKLDELDYEEELDDSKCENTDAKPNDVNKISNADESSDDGAISENDSDGEVKNDHNNANEDDSDGEVKSPKPDNDEFKDPPATPETEEDGEINDGERVKKAFIPRVLCKYYQRGKCTWGRTCKFLHPGVNDTGNYSFLEFQDPNAKVYQQQMMPESEEVVEKKSGEEAAEVVETESAWERGLRHAREMKEKAKQRKLADKDQFEEKKMNLSLKEFENEKENDERYFNVVKIPNADDEEDEDLHLFAQSGRLANIDRSGSSHKRPERQEAVTYPNNRSHENDTRRSSQYNVSDYRPRQASDYRGGGGGERGSAGGSRREVSPHRSGRAKADEWHDPWDRSRQPRRDAPARRDRSHSYSSSGSGSKSRNRSGSRSSYSSSSSKSYSSRSSRSNSSRSGSRSPKSGKKSGQRNENKKPNPKQLSNDLKKKIESLKNKASVKTLPGRQISDISLKKAGLDAEKSIKKEKKGMSRSRSNSSMSSYGSSDSKSDDDDMSHDSDSYSDDNDDYDSKAKKKSSAKKSLKQGSKSLKRSAPEAKAGSDSKKSKVSGTGDKPGASSDKKQMIKDQLKLLESALKKKSMTK